MPALRRQRLLAVFFGNKKRRGREPLAALSQIFEGLSVAILLDRQVVEVVISPMLEKSSEKEVVLQCFCIVGYVPRAAVDIRQRLL